MRRSIQVLSAVFFVSLIVLICNTGVRSYEAQVILDQMGIRNSRNLQGGVAAVRKLGLYPAE